MIGHSESASIDWRILVLAPTGQDAELSIGFLQKAGLYSEACRNVQELAEGILTGSAALLIAEEALELTSIQMLNTVLEQQPSWSDLPITLITSQRVESEKVPKFRKIFAPGANVTILERPFRPGTLVSTLEVALRARRRQYQIRDLLKERAEHLKELERRVAERTADLLELNAHLESLVYTVAHDLRTPLRGIQGYSKLLLDDCGPVLDEMGKRHLARIQTAAERMDNLVIDLMAYGRIARAEVELTAVPLEEAWDAALAQCEGLIESRGAVVQSSPPFPRVRAHLPTLTQVLANLLNNAVTFVPRNVEPAVSFWTEDAGANVRAWMKDNGIGIAPEHHERIFRLFERVGSVSEPGTGVGLSIVRKGIERMGGTVGVESSVGQGSRFWIELPKAT
ncbi:MAG TPA: HAMP domain-containing sensor histidine kinase [Verrucomicrobiae bacterium]|nr:HAMP domain-containing sensor histidine kinase [Verrucomicrobiae bacterium]